MGYDTILFEKENGIAIITLNRSDKLNAINVKVRDELISVLEDAGNDHQVRVVILNGGKKVFCVGADINELPTPELIWDKISPRRTYSYYHLWPLS